MTPKDITRLGKLIFEFKGAKPKPDWYERMAKQLDVTRSRVYGWATGKWKPPKWVDGELLLWQSRWDDLKRDKKFRNLPRPSRIEILCGGNARTDIKPTLLRVRRGTISTGAVKRIRVYTPKKPTGDLAGDGTAPEPPPRPTRT